MKDEFDNLMMDYYELTMGQVYFNEGKQDEIAYFDLYFRKAPDGSGFAIANGIDKCIRYLKQFCFKKRQIDYLRSLKCFTEDYLRYLRRLKFTGDVWAVQDGTVVIPNEPILTIKAPIIQAQLIETALLTIINRSSLITTKASRIVRSAQGRAIMEFGSRRAHGQESAIEGAKDAYIAGAIGTACVASGQRYNIPVLGTMAHSFVQSFDSEYKAFEAYARAYSDNCILLIDTYDTLNSGIINAVNVYKNVLKPMGKQLKGVRIDSGDLLSLSKKVRSILDENGLSHTAITVSSSLDEYKIKTLLDNDAPIDNFGVGENLITAKSQPVFGGVYKLVALEKDGKILPKIKLSEDVVKTINPHFKTVYRFYDEKGKIAKDYLCVFDEKASVEDRNILCLYNKVLDKGKVVCPFKSAVDKRLYLQEQINTLTENQLKLIGADTIKLELSEKLQHIKNTLINQVT